MTLSEPSYIQAKLTLLATADGGRKTGIKTGYRPNHVFEYSAPGSFKTTYIGDIQFEPDKTIVPGETAIVIVCFLLVPIVPELSEYLTIGRKWYLHEGARLIGYAEILKDINADIDKYSVQRLKL
jgi:hypothetical protein